MMPKRRRLTRHSFPTDFRSGVVLHAPHFSLRAVAHKDTHERVSVVVSKKVAASAVDRHLIKRRVYDVVEDVKLVPAAYVFFAKADAHKISFKELREEINGLMNDVTSSFGKRGALV